MTVVEAWALALTVAPVALTLGPFLLSASRAEAPIRFGSGIVSEQTKSKRGSRRQRGSVRDVFDHIAGRITKAVGSPVAVVLAVIVILAWGVTGPLFGFSDTWQLVINTGTTIITFLMVFVIQTTQNRDSEALHLKLDELIRAVRGARNEFITVEQDTEEELASREREMAEVAESVAREAGHPDAAGAARRAARAATRRQGRKQRKENKD